MVIENILYHRCTNLFIDSNMFVFHLNGMAQGLLTGKKASYKTKPPATTPIEKIYI